MAQPRLIDEEASETLFRMSRIWLGAAVGLLLGLAVAGALLVPVRWLIGHGAFANLLTTIVSASFALLTAAAGGMCALRIVEKFVLVQHTTPTDEVDKLGVPHVLDTSAIIDGRIADVQATGVLTGSLVAPKVVVNELQALADSPDRTRRGRGRRGLDLLDRLRNSPHGALTLWNGALDAATAAGPVDLQLVAIAKLLSAKLVTGDFNLGKVARLEGIQVINLNDVASALRPVMAPGDALQVELMKPGESPNQGVGYLDDGTMVVVDGGRDRMNQTVTAIVTSVLQTSAGRMIFARLADSAT